MHYPLEWKGQSWLLDKNKEFCLDLFLLFRVKALWWGGHQIVSRVAGRTNHTHSGLSEKCWWVQLTSPGSCAHPEVNQLGPGKGAFCLSAVAPMWTQGRTGRDGKKPEVTRQVISDIYFIYVPVCENLNHLRCQHHYTWFTNKERFLEKLSHTDDKWLVWSISESKCIPFPLWHDTHNI